MLRRVAPHTLVVLAALCLAGACGCAERGGKAPRREASAGVAPRVLIVGLDGADWEIVDRLQAQGRLPTLERWRREGAWGVLRSEPPLISPVVWTTIATGRSPLDHGIFGFLTRRGGVDEPVRADERRVRAFWNIAGDLGARVGVLGWYATWPAEPVNGFLVSDRAGAHQVAGGGDRPAAALTWPADLAPDVDKVRLDVERETGADAARAYFAPGADVSALRAGTLDGFVGVLRTTEMYRRLLPALLARFNPAVAAVYFEGTDSVAHLFMDYIPPAPPTTDPRLASMFGGALDAYYARVDAVLGELTAGLDPARTTVIVVSDHGLRTGENRPRTSTLTDAGNQAPQWHRPDGVVLLWGRGVVAGARLAESRIYDVLPTVLRLAGLPSARNLSGHVIDQALAAAVLGTAPPPVADFEARGPRALTPPPGPVDREAADEQIARLRALGYVGAAAPGRAAGGGSDDGQGAISDNVYNHAILLEEAGRRAEALALFREMQRRWPSTATGFAGEGLALLNEDQAAQAVGPLARAVALGPQVATSHALLGEALFRSGRAAEAALSLSRSLELDPGAARPALMLARLLMMQGQSERAAPLLERARDEADWPADRAAALVDLGVVAEDGRQLDRAEQMYRRALETVPDFPPALERYANLLMYLDRPADASGLLDRLTQIDPRNPRALTLSAFALARLGRKAEARAVLRRSLALAPQQPDARQLLADLGP